MPSTSQLGFSGKDSWHLCEFCMEIASFVLRSSSSSHCQSYLLRVLHYAPTLLSPTPTAATGQLSEKDFPLSKA
eukprot:1742173-Rhodomonas_salina.1